MNKPVDVILINGDATIDSPYVGVAVIYHWLMAHGFTCKIISQPDLKSPVDITRYGEPRLFWGVSAGCTDSMVANTTALLKRRRSCDFTPGGVNDKRPDRACIAYTNLIRSQFKKTKPIILGGVEASLRRLTHYDYWTDSLRKSLLLDSKADAIIYGQGERAVLELATQLREGKSIDCIPGLVHLKNKEEDLAPYLGGNYIRLPSHEECLNSKEAFTKLFHLFYENNDPLNAQGLILPTMNRFVVQNPPASHLTSKELDLIYEFPYTYDVAPELKDKGEVKALITISNSITTHRGCYGECNFCSITVHQGRRVVSRSEESILREATKLSKMKQFKGYIQDVGGATANMYGFECDKKIKSGACKKKRCLSTHPCPALKINHGPSINLLNKLQAINGIKKVFVASGIRFDLVFKDAGFGKTYLRSVIKDHLSGQMKVAPEHSDASVLQKMGKCDPSYYDQFEKEFYKVNREEGKKQLLSHYFIAAHPGCGEKEMKLLKKANEGRVGLKEQVQVFTPTPSTYSTLMYYTGKDPYSGEEIFIEKGLRGKSLQKDMLYE